MQILCNLQAALKKANALRVRSKPIASNIGYPTRQVSHFLHCQLRDAVISHEFVLKDSISLIRQLECMNISQTQDVILTSADVAALYPSINLEDGLTAMQWFMTRYTSIPLGLQRLYILLAQFVMENNYVECDSLPDANLQTIGTAICTSFWPMPQSSWSDWKHLSLRSFVRIFFCTRGF